jgi:hypothetical protein
MDNPVALTNYTGMASLLRYGFLSYGSFFKDRVERLDSFASFLKWFGFTEQQEKLESLIKDIRAELEKHDEGYDYGKVGSWEKKLPSADEFESRLREIVNDANVVFGERIKGVMVLETHTSKSAELLRRFVRPMARGKTLLIDQTVRCLECGAFSSAIVMGWNLTYDMFRDWIFSSKRKRLKAFNIALTTGKYANKKYDPIDIYEDFFVLGEFIVLEVAYEAKLIKKNLHQALQRGLTGRNHHAHPSGMIATLPIADGYVHDLVTNILMTDKIELLIKKPRKPKTPPT